MKKLFLLLERIRVLCMSFSKDLEYGRTAEDIVIEFYENKEKYDILDVTWDEHYQDQDIDLIIQDTERGKSTTFEVKNATATIRKNGTLAIESHCVYKKNYTHRTGWVWTSKAHVFAFVDTDNEVFYVIRSRDLRKYIYENNLKNNQIDTYVYDEDCKRTWVYYIKLDDLKALNSADYRVLNTCRVNK